MGTVGSRSEVINDPEASDSIDFSCSAKLLNFDSLQTLHGKSKHLTDAQQQDLKTVIRACSHLFQDNPTRTNHDVDVGDASHCYWKLSISHWH